MLAANIEQEVKTILEKKGRNGWLRVQECAKEYGKDPLTKDKNDSRITKFYRWRKQVQKGRVEGFKVQLLPGNVSFIGLSNADPEVLNEFISEDKKVSRNVKSGIGFFEWRARVAELRQLEKREKEAKWFVNHYNKLLFQAEHLKSLGVDVDKDIRILTQEKREWLKILGVDIE